jgi:hypothetical protein
MKITFSLKYEALAMSTNRLPDPIIEALTSKRKFWRDLGQRLAFLPVVHKARYIGTMPEESPHENAVQYAKQNGLQLCVGYIVWQEAPNEPWKIDVYSFCVRPEDERVIDPTKGHDWSKMRVYYLGFKVPAKDIAGMKYLHYFERMNYLVDHVA